MDIKGLKESMDKKFGKNAVAIGSDAKGLHVRKFSTGIFSLDVELSGGWPEGRVIEIFGPEHSGKTLLAFKAVKSYLNKYPDAVCFWCDAEKTFDPKWAKKNGLDMDRVLISYPDSGEEGCEAILEAFRESDLVIVVIDSLAMLVPMNDVDKDMQDNMKVASHPQMVTNLVKKLGPVMRSDLTKDNPKSVLIGLNQLREKVGVMFGSNEKTPGGRAWRHGVSVKVRVRREKWITEGTKKEKINVGYNMQIRIDKDKTGTGIGRVADIEFYNRNVDDHKTFGFNNYRALRLEGVKLDLIKTTGTIHEYCGLKNQTKNFEMKLRQDKKLSQKLRKEIMDIVTRNIVTDTLGEDV